MVSFTPLKLSGFLVHDGNISVLVEDADVLLSLALEWFGLSYVKIQALLTAHCTHDIA